jgi:hypothetical protein
MNPCRCRSSFLSLHHPQRKRSLWISITISIPRGKETLLISITFSHFLIISQKKGVLLISITSLHVFSPRGKEALYVSITLLLFRRKKILSLFPFLSKITLQLALSPQQKGTLQLALFLPSEGNPAIISFSIFRKETLQ